MRKTKNRKSKKKLINNFCRHVIFAFLLYRELYSEKLHLVQEKLPILWSVYFMIFHFIKTFL